MSKIFQELKVEKRLRIRVRTGTLWNLRLKMVQQFHLAQKFNLVITILFFSLLFLLIFNFDVNLVFPILLNEHMRGVIVNSKTRERNYARHQNDHQLPRENKSEVRNGQMDLY